MWMNEYDVEEAHDQFRNDPVLGPAVRTLVNLVVWTDRHSDGWCYWPKPSRAAAKLMDLIQQAQKVRRSVFHPDDDVDYLALYKKALVPVKAFRTRQGADFEVVEVVQ